MTDKLAAAEESQWRNLETQTGKSKAQWLKLATAKKLDKHGELVAWLKRRTRHWPWVCKPDRDPRARVSQRRHLGTG